MTMKLTEAQRRALKRMAENYGTESVLFNTGEALRRRGLADRYTERVSHAVYVTKDSETFQSWPPSDKHQWFITPAGRRAIAKEVERG